MNILILLKKMLKTADLIRPLLYYVKIKFRIRFLRNPVRKEIWWMRYELFSRVASDRISLCIIEIFFVFQRGPEPRNIFAWNCILYNESGMVLILHKYKGFWRMLQFIQLEDRHYVTDIVYTFPTTLALSSTSLHNYFPQ